MPVASNRGGKRGRVPVARGQEGEGACSIK